MRLLNTALRLKRENHEGATEAALLLEKAALEELEKRSAINRARILRLAARNPAKDSFRHTLRVSEDQQQFRRRAHGPEIWSSPELPAVSAGDKSGPFLPGWLRPSINPNSNVDGEELLPIRRGPRFPAPAGFHLGSSRGVSTANLSAALLRYDHLKAHSQARTFRALE